MSESECGESLRTHMCQGPLYKVIDNGRSVILCMGVVKRLIREGHDIEIKENVPRKFKKKTSGFNNRKN